MNEAHSYCLDANVLIQAWDGYYSPRLCGIRGASSSFAMANVSTSELSKDVSTAKE